MKVDCQHWRDLGVEEIGRCTLNLYGGRPSTGICTQFCPRREPNRGVIGQVAHGATGLAKVAAGVGIAPDEIVDARKAVCNTCEFKTSAFYGMTTKCEKCGCILPAKQKLLSERCPEGKWDSISLPVIK